jgi:hypothetical protein
MHKSFLKVGKMEMAVFGYARVSTLDQTLASQEAQLMAASCPRTNGGRPLRALRRAFRRPIWRDPTACRKRRSADWLHRALSGQSRSASRQARETEAALGHVEPTFFRRFGLLVVISREAQQGPLSQLVPHLLRESADFRGALAPSVGLSRGPCHGAKA